MNKILVLLVAVLVASGFTKVNAQYVFQSATPFPFTIPLGGSANGSFVFSIEGNDLNEGALGARYEVKVESPNHGISITSATLTINPNPGTPVVFTQEGTSVIADDYGSTYSVGTVFTLNYTATSDGSGSVGNQVTIGLVVTDAMGSLLEASNAPVTLPVTLASFNVTKEGSKVATLSWKTTEETNSDYFEVQHSLNAKDWEAVGKVQSHNDGKAIHNYSFSYAGKTNGKNYFRLNMVDLDGTSQRSSVRSVTFENLGEEMVSFGPNPTSDYLNIKLSDWSTVKSVSILDKMGRHVYSSGAKPENTISVRNFNSGLYLLKLTRNNGEVIVNKILVNK